MTALPTYADARPSVGRRAATVARRLIGVVGRLSLVGAIAGATWLGLGSRIAMRVVALASGEPTELTLAGTGFLLLAGTTAGVIVTVTTIGMLGRWVPPGRTGRLAVAALTAAPPAFVLLDPSNVDVVLFDHRWLTVGLFGLLPIAFGATVARLLPVLAASALDPRREPPRVAAVGRVATLLLAGAGAATLVWRAGAVALV